MGGGCCNLPLSGVRPQPAPKPSGVPSKTPLLPKHPAHRKLAPTSNSRISGSRSKIECGIWHCCMRDTRKLRQHLTTSSLDTGTLHLDGEGPQTRCHVAGLFLQRRGERKRNAIRLGIIKRCPSGAATWLNCQLAAGAGPLKRQPDVGRTPGWFLEIPFFRKLTHQLLKANLPTGAAKKWKKHNPHGKVSGEVPGGFWKNPPCRLERLNSG